jgi:hypothetical protein
LACAWTVLLVSGCGGGSASNSDAGVADAAGVDANETCATYTTSSIAAMRTAATTGCFELAHVITIATRPTSVASASAELYVQDLAAGNFSAMQLRCGGTHPCADPSYRSVVSGRDVTVRGRYVEVPATHLEQFYIDTLVDNGPGSPPPAATAGLGDIQRSGTPYHLVFQYVTLTINGADPLVMYDWTPSEYVVAASVGLTTCVTGGDQLGWGMIPMSTPGVSQGGACTNTTTQPPGQASPNPNEVLIDQRFYRGFTVTSDCRCALQFSEMKPSTTSQLSGTVSGVLIFDVAAGANVGYTALAPTLNSDAPITNTL